MPGSVERRGLSGRMSEAVAVVIVVDTGVCRRALTTVVLCFGVLI